MNRMAKPYRVKGKVWVHPGEMGAWHFVAVDKKQSAELKEKYAKMKRGFGSLRVRVTLGKTSWDTSIFPEKRSGTYLLPLKAAVRRAEGIQEGDTIQFTLAIPLSLTIAICGILLINSLNCVKNGFEKS